ncbi:MAG: hypothetical protein CO189_05000 [candidate division Zixibacteria bacterium CG_4_9_14_3_um_filter_46_8]|nr:MAG: hypothetical protein CO189_05000 [candidate division Zixibacteria bacterium CG_4_9_14_3_um_filter_46_8]
MIYSGDSPIQAVQMALGELESLEEEIIVRYHLMGETHKAIGEILHLEPRPVRNIRLKGLDKLRSMLSPFVMRRYRVSIEGKSICPLCLDGRFDKLIMQCAPYGPWAPVFMEIEKNQFKAVKSVSTIRYHYEHHLMKGSKHD